MATGNGEAAVVEKEGEGTTVPDAAEKVLSEAADNAVSEALEKVVLDAAEKAEEKESGRMITLKSSDGERVEVTEAEAEAEASARISKAIGNMIDDVCGDHGIPLPMVDTKTIMKMAEYCNKHSVITDKEELKNWDEGFINELDSDEDKDSLFKLIWASEHLGIDGLLDLASGMVARKIKAGKTIEEIHKFLGVENDFTEEEEEKILRENAWAFEE